MKIGLAVQVLPLTHPLHLAEDAATVDQLSHGRLDFGIGRSGLPAHYSGFSVPYGESRARFLETLEVLESPLPGSWPAQHGEEARMADPLKALNLRRWIDDHRSLLKPPIGAEVIWKDSEFMVMLIGGPNARRDFHIDPRDELFYQLEGDMVLEYIDGRGRRQRENIREGDVLLLPANTPHSPQRPANTVGLVVEPVRGPDEPEGYAWYCERCDATLYEMSRGEGDILIDLRRVSERFNASEALRTCKPCGYVQPVATGPRF